MKPLFTRTTRGWALIVSTPRGDCHLDLPPEGITRELIEDSWLGESWKRLLTAWPLAIKDWDRDMWVWPTSRRYWYLTRCWLLYPMWRLLLGLGLWEVSEGAYFSSGRFRWFSGRRAWWRR